MTGLVSDAQGRLWVQRRTSILSEGARAGLLQPNVIGRSIETNHRINTASRANGGLFLVVAIAPLGNGVWRIFLQTVVASGNLATKESIAMQG
ncbi:hypothetical protein [Acidovorax sp.]|uniref:hypothetical protein n=1 Tax=Acidovorax sp. TaxID=1872122 RepID=UPI0026162569|nr:hypothetical protein [Acidovorax sp.]